MREDLIAILQESKYLEGVVLWAALLLVWRFASQKQSASWPSPFVLAFGIAAPCLALWDLVLDPLAFDAQLSNWPMVLFALIALFPSAPFLIAVTIGHVIGVWSMKCRSDLPLAQFIVVALHVAQACYLIWFSIEWRMGEANA